MKGNEEKRMKETGKEVKGKGWKGLEENSHGKKNCRGNTKTVTRK